MLPIDFKVRMKELLGDEYDCFERSYGEPEYKALRLNPLKVDRTQFLMLLNELSASVDETDGTGTVFEPVGWESGGFYYEDPLRPGRHPLHEAGAYYIQEPSAMKPVTLLDARPGERVLDLCAAPGGKSTQIAGYMQGRGLLVCNEIIPSRAKVLSENIERMGVANALVLNETPQRLRDTFTAYFDKILVDAPCSGEGMFRKNDEAAQEWSIENVHMCAERQDEILDCAASMLRPGGTLVYSTCTFSKEEDEECIERFTDRHPGYEVIIEEKLFPHRVKGEGHFMAKLILGGAGNLPEAGDAVNVKSTDPGKAKTGRTVGRSKGTGAKDGRIKEFLAFCKDNIPGGTDFFNDMPVCSDIDTDRLIFFGDNLYLLPEGSPDLAGLKVVRSGLHLGTYHKDRFEPAHAWAMSLRSHKVCNTVDITFDEARSYLSGMTLPHVGDKGWYLVSYKGISLGWGKLAGNIIKNHYPKGLRRTC